jgi:hypothetical protein
MSQLTRKSVPGYGHVDERPSCVHFIHSTLRFLTRVRPRREGLCVGLCRLGAFCAGNARRILRGADRQVLVCQDPQGIRVRGCMMSYIRSDSRVVLEKININKRPFQHA